MTDPFSAMKDGSYFKRRKSVKNAVEAFYDQPLLEIQPVEVDERFD